MTVPIFKLSNQIEPLYLQYSSHTDGHNSRYVDTTAILRTAEPTTAAAAVPPPPPLLLLLLLLLLLCRYSLLRAFHKTQNEKQSVETGCAPRCIAGREAAAAQQQHSSSTAAAQQQQQQQQQQRRRRRWRWRRRGSNSGQLPFGVSGWQLCCVSVAERVGALSVLVCTSGCPSLPWLRSFGLGIKLGAC